MFKLPELTRIIGCGAVAGTHKTIRLQVLGILSPGLGRKLLHNSAYTVLCSNQKGPTGTFLYIYTDQTNNDGQIENKPKQ